MASRAPHDNREFCDMREMTSEINRLHSFELLKPFSMPASTSCRLARCGLYWNGITKGVLNCIFCGHTVSVTDRNDPLEKHRRRNPICPMFANNLTDLPSVLPFDVLQRFEISGNESEDQSHDLVDYFQGNQQLLQCAGGLTSSPLLEGSIKTLRSCIDRASLHNPHSSNTTSSPLVLNRRDPDLQTRPASLPVWSHQMSLREPEDLIQTGFYYTGIHVPAQPTNETIVCPFSGEILPDNGQTLRNSRNPDFDDEIKRRESFNNPATIPRGQAIDALLKAGYYYVGPLDNTRCFHCSVQFVNWGSEDDPWIVHAKWSPECGFLRSRCHHRFIKAISQAHGACLTAIEEMKLKLQNEKDDRAMYEENRRLHEERLCKACHAEDISVVLIPCGHPVCRVCRPTLQNCPKCQLLITGSEKFILGD